MKIQQAAFDYEAKAAFLCCILLLSAGTPTAAFAGRSAGYRYGCRSIFRVCDHMLLYRYAVHFIDDLDRMNDRNNLRYKMVSNNNDRFTHDGC